MADFDHNLHTFRTGQQGGGGSSGGTDGTNEKDIFQGAIDEVTKLAYTGAKMTGLPINLGEVGQHGIQKVLGGDTEGISGKNIPSIMDSMSARGGFLANLLHSIFIKNREVTDHTQGVAGGGEGGNFAGGGAEGGFASGGGDFGGGNFSDLVGSAGSYGSMSYADIPMENIGNLKPYAPGGGGAAIELS